MAEPSDKGSSVLKQFEKLKAIRAPLDQEYRDAYNYTSPKLGAGFGQDEIDGIAAAQSAKAKQAQLYDSTATDAVRLLSSSVLSSLTPPGVRWFDLEPPLLETSELDQDGKEWLADSAARIHTMIHASNYDSEAFDFITHQMIAGMAGLYVELKNEKFHFETWPLNHLYCQETLNEGYIDSVYRAHKLTAMEAVNEFGLENLPSNIQDVYKNDPYSSKTFRFVTAIRPRLKGGKQSEGKTKKNLPWESLYVAECGTIVKESGFNEMPVIVPRWLRIPDTDYAIGPVSDALPDIKSLNKVRENMLLNMDMHITGMFKVKDDGVLNPNTIKFGARRTITVADMDSIQPLQSGGDIEFAINQVGSLQAAVRKMLLADQLGPTDKVVATAAEMHARAAQVRQILGPIFARIQSEFLKHLVARCFGLTARANLLPPVPQSISNGSGAFEVQYRSPLARSQKMQELEAIDQMTTRLQGIAQMKPEIMDYINFDAIVREYGDLLAVNPELMNDEAAVKKIRYNRDKAQKEQAAAAERVATAEAQAKAPPMPANPVGELELMA
ncbi:MAG: portal protein [Polaromonas sp.]|nr:portal protein [Polaromonas sp.]